MIIGINGYSGSGKDTVGTIIQYVHTDSEVPLKKVLKKPANHIWWLEDGSGWEIKKWAGKLKDIASLLTGIPVEKFEDQEFKKELLGPEWGTVGDTPLSSIPVFEHIKFNRLITVREFLQKLGTDGLRNGLHENVWVNALMADYVPTGDNLLDGEVRKVREEDLIYPNWIITDTRFPNEAEAIRKKDGIIIRIERPGVQPINNHPSEVGLDGYDFDHTIINDGSLKDLTKKVKKVLKAHNIL